MKAVRASGFTLIELLTVIAIMAILFGLTAVALPRLLERARITDVETDMEAISASLQAYYTNFGTYPPGYGFQLFQQDTNADPIYKHDDYTLDIGINGALKLYDRFSTDYDTDGDNTLSRLEFIPFINNFLDLAPIDPPYAGGQALTGTYADFQRPYVYVPYYKKDMDRMRRVVGTEWNGAAWNANIIGDATVVPPPEYDAFVLLSVGPLINTRGLITPPGGDEDAWLTSTGETMPEQSYYALSLRAAYLSTRDANGNGELDFDYRPRTRSGEASDTRNTNMPDLPDGPPLFPAPIIFVSD
ncbi:MAG: type II secretion system protein [Candidatus Hydrogenedentes bacterium]|nr:type II secretion system protein [Candidatus Hydrogenedentota bacterium]